MEVHRPKAGAHGWRAFINEVAIIVLGVLIALAGEQTVEALHWVHKVNAGREASREELVSAAYNATERVLLADCRDQRINFLEARLRTASAAWTAQPWSRLASSPLFGGQAYAAPMRNWDTDVWRSLVADGTAVHLPRAEMLRLSSLYRLIDNLQAQNADERRATARIAMLGQGFELSGAARYEIQMALEEQRAFNRLMALGSGQMLADMKTAGLAPHGPAWEQEIAGIRSAEAACRGAPSTAPGF